MICAVCTCKRANNQVCFVLYVQAALDKQKLTMPELYEDILGTEREKKPDS